MPPFSLIQPNLPFLLFILHYPSCSSSYTTLPSLYSTQHFLLIAILHYPSFSSRSYTANPSFSLSDTTLPSPLHPRLPLLLSILHCKHPPSVLHYPSFVLICPFFSSSSYTSSFSQSYTTLPFLYPTGYSSLPSPLHSTLPRKERYIKV